MMLRSVSISIFIDLCKDYFLYHFSFRKYYFEKRRSYCIIKNPPCKFNGFIYILKQYNCPAGKRGRRLCGIGCWNSYLRIVVQILACECKYSEFPIGELTKCSYHSPKIIHRIKI